MSSTRGRDTTPELAVRRLLHARGHRYRVNYRPLDDKRRSVDIVFTRLKLAVMIDGCFWHGCPDHYRPASNRAAFWAAKIAGNRARDVDTDRRLREAGWVVVRYWEHDDPDSVVEGIEAEILRAKLALQAFR
ncbi:very short patch repair endonuclease [Tessaracoccus sp. SD287]|nr:very short patch repair endonuclease [Tessaracoccus sp. SD287]